MLGLLFLPLQSNCITRHGHIAKMSGKQESAKLSVVQMTLLVLCTRL